MKQNALRGTLLDFLKHLYPEGGEIGSINAVFYQYHRIDDISEALEYLADKGYIQKKEIPHPYKKQEVVRWFKILPKGIDLIDGNIPHDPGIDIPRG